MPDRRQFDVALPADLVRRVEHRAADEHLTTSDFVQRAVEAGLETPGPIDELDLSRLAPPDPAVELTFSSPEPLDRLEQRLRDAGVEILSPPAGDQDSERRLQVRGSHGLLVTIHERDSGTPS